ncbi:amino acid adenylation domain-containing protein [Streptomyces sp. NPDC051658]|uniref:amino acid adenylation domain-containing protein n=1 Tax=Streptomyces sp. NPDC051658 TaxID=3365667 RepID=UPI003791509F
MDGSTDRGTWAASLEGAGAPEIALDHPRLTARDYRPGSESVKLSPESLAKLQNSAAAPELVVLTAWAGVLHRHTMQTDFLLGLDVPTFSRCPAEQVTHARPLPAVLPLRIQLRPEASFRTELERVHASLTDALRAAAVHGVPGTAAELRAFAGAAPAATLQQHAPDTALHLHDEHLELRYNASLLTRASARWMLRHCSTLLEHALTKPNQALRDLPVRESDPVPPTWSLPVPDGYVAPRVPQPGESLVARFAATVAMHRSRDAVAGPSGTLTYGDLDDLSTSTGRRLKRVAGPGRRIGVLCTHDVSSVAAIWSVLKAGSAYVPLDPRQPDSRLSRLLLDAEVDAVLCDPELADRAKSLARGKRVVTLDTSVTPPPDTGLDPQCTDVSVAYLLHTSGSTGRPKAVVQSHGNALAHALTYAERLRIGPGDQIPLMARYTFDAAVMDLFGALLTGATLHVVDALLPAPDLRRRLAEARASIVHCTPTLFRHLIGAVSGGAPGGAMEFGTVRAVVLGGEEATQQDLRAFLDAFPATSVLVNGLGPTECTMALQHAVTRDDLGSTGLPVGHPVEGVEVRLIDPEGHPTEIFGELEIRSERVALGYHRQPETTRTAFGVDATGTRYYRSGDLARRRADGAFAFSGRADRQIKIRGYRIEPGEIEAVLRGHPTVAEAVVTVDKEQATPRLVGYVTPSTPFLPDTEELHNYLTRTLPEYAVPWRLLALEKLPLGPTGKLDRSALPAPDQLVPAESEAPSSPAEVAVAAVWCRVLGVSSVGRNANFMASGGDSLSLLEVLTSVKTEFDVEVDLIDFLSVPTIARMAEMIERESAC